MIKPWFLQLCGSSWQQNINNWWVPWSNQNVLSVLQNLLLWKKNNYVKSGSFVVPWTSYHPCLALLWLPQCQWSIHGGYGIRLKCTPDSRVQGAYMGPTWGWQDPGGPHVGPTNLAIRDSIKIRIYVFVWFNTQQKAMPWLPLNSWIFYKFASQLLYHCNMLEYLYMTTSH